MPAYHPQKIEPRWQRYWEEHKTFKTLDFVAGKPKLYVLDMFPYPSGAGLHVGHPEGYTATDIFCRYKRMRGFNVLHPMGWDAFGLPAEQYAVQTNTHPRITTQKNIATFRRQIQSLGFSYDWDREVDTTDPGYYRWTQWIFLHIYNTWYDPDFAWTDPQGRPRMGKGRPIAELPIPPDCENPAAYRDSRRLAYRALVPVNWCPELGTVLANEEVKDGKSERGSHPVVRMPLQQWMLRITAYGERLIEDLETLDWSPAIKDMQRNWVGRSEGAEIDFRVKGQDPAPEGEPAEFPEKPAPGVLRVFTTRPDTLFGATYMVLAPEHPLVGAITTPGQLQAVEAYREAAARKSDLDRTDLAKVKSGVFTGAFAINPVNNEEIPIWIADYVLMGYGTGAIMAVPGHDERDFAFARAHDLPIRAVVMPPQGWLTHNRGKALAGVTDPGELQAAFAADPGRFDASFCDDGHGLNSSSGSLSLDGVATAQAKTRMRDWLEASKLGRGTVQYKLRDWLFSRQRYWGEPFPVVIEEDGSARALDAGELPVLLPEVADFRPTGRPEPPLGKAVDWIRYSETARRETNTMPQWAGSCWYYLRYIDPHNDQRPWDPDKERYWLPVDLYIGGAEHAVLHLLYARFWHKVLFDNGLVHTQEPFQKLVNQGMILGETEYTAYRDADGAWVGIERVAELEGRAVDRRAAEQRPLERVRLEESQITKKGDSFVLADNPAIRIDARAQKMSKSLGNVINPDTVVSEYGADALRLYEMFMGPLEATKPWSMKGVEGVYRFLGRAWRMIVDHEAEAVCLDGRIQDVEPALEQSRLVARTILAVTDDIERLSFNTAISRLMEFVNAFTSDPVRPRSSMSAFVLLLAPFAPHLAEELWSLLGNANTLAYEPWPTFDPALLVESEVEVPVQVLGKIKARILVPASSDATALEAAARADTRIASLLEGKTVVKVVAVPGKLVNFVIR